MKSLSGLLVFLVGWIGTSTPGLFAESHDVASAQQNRINVIKVVAPSVVAIFSADGNEGGSGVLISADGYALSNFHVTSACGEFMKCGLNDGVLYDAVIVGIDPTGDVALVRLLGRDDFPHATLGDSDRVAVGDWAYAMGNPFLLATDFQPTVTFGMVSGTHRYQYPAGTFLEYTDCIQVDTSINPGNSGGPLFNSAGELIGINGRIAVEKRGRVNVGAGYAISINQIRHFMGHLRGGLVVDHATLGATVRTGADRAVFVESILESSPAYRRGLREGDEIVSFADRPIGSVNQFKNILGIYPKGWSLPLIYRREGIKRSILVELPAMHSKSELTMPSEPKAPRGPRPIPRNPNAPGDNNRAQAVLPEEELPADYKKMFEKKNGYANYYFNLVEQKRILEGLVPFAGWKGFTGKWSLTGQTTDGDSIQLKLLARALTAQFMKRAPGLQKIDGSEFLDEPPGSGGLLAAFYQLKLLLTEGPTAFSDFHYAGSQPLDGGTTFVHVLSTKISTLDSRWYFSAEDGKFVGFDSSLGLDVDACEVRFLRTGDFGGRPFPNRIGIKYGETDFGTFDLNSIETETRDDRVE